MGLTQKVYIDVAFEYSSDYVRLLTLFEKLNSLAPRKVRWGKGCAENAQVPFTRLGASEKGIKLEGN